MAKGRVLGSENEIAALGELRTPAVRDAVHSRDERLSQLAHRIQRPIEILTLAEPLLFGHIPALAQVTANRKRALPAPVKIAARTVGRTAMVSMIWVSSAPISVLIALSGGRLSVITATRPPEM